MYVVPNFGICSTSRSFVNFSNALFKFCDVMGFFLHKGTVYIILNIFVCAQKPLENAFINM